MFCLKVAAFLSIINIIIVKCDDDLVVQLIPGKIQGHILQSYEGQDFYAFQEIPYATPPVGKLRLQPSIEPEPWDGILNTTQNTKVCVQKNTYTINKTEDCLYLNVYSPLKPGTKERLPVLFWIHGGGLNWGSGTIVDYGPKYIMDYGIVVVAINYRLNAFGFASTGDDVIPGNLGLKDMRLALEWVNNHIALFGGNPNHVVIAGESSGSAAVGLLVMGEWNGEKELFHGAIQESGSMIGGTIQWKPKENIIGLSRQVDANFTSEDSKDILELLQSVDAQDILHAGRTYLNSIESSGHFSYLPLQSFMDGNFKKVPIMIGWNSEEYIKYAKNRSNGTLRNFDNNPELLVHSNINMTPENRTKAGKLMHAVYTRTSFVEDFGAYIRAGRTYLNSIESSGHFSYLPLQSFMDGNFKNVPMMIGWNSEEYIKYVTNRDNTTLLQGLDDDPSQLIHANIHMSPENRTKAGRLYKKVYTNRTFMEDFAAYIRWSSDQSFATPTGKQIELGSPLAPYYVYQFSYKGELGGMMDDKYIVPGAERVGHMEDLHYWWEFLNNSDLSKFSEEDRLMMKRFLTLWTNFIKYFNPTPSPDPLLQNITWPRSDPEKLTYLNINSTFEVRTNPRVYRFVKPIIEEYMEEPYAQFG